MSKMMVLIRKEILEQWRTRKILILCIIFLFVAISSPVIAKLTPELLKNISVPGLTINLPEATYKDSVDQFIKNISQIVLFVLVFVIAGVVSDEKSKKTLEIILTKPLSRVKFILSKFISSLLIISIIYIISCTVFYAYTMTTFSAFNIGSFALVSGMALLYILMIVSITILASTIVKNPIVAGGIGFANYIVFGIIFGLIKSLDSISPNYIFLNYKQILASGWTGDLVMPIVVNLIIILVSIVAAVSIFKRQEIER